MATTSVSIVAIPWDDGSGDSFYLDFTQVITSEDQVVSISSDYNTTDYARSKILRFQAKNVEDSLNQAAAVLKVTQQVDNLIVASFEDMVSVYSPGEIRGGYGQAIKYD